MADLSAAAPFVLAADAGLLLPARLAPLALAFPGVGCGFFFDMFPKRSQACAKKQKRVVLGTPFSFTCFYDLGNRWFAFHTVFAETDYNR